MIITVVNKKTHEEKDYKNVTGMLDCSYGNEVEIKQGQKITDINLKTHYIYRVMEEKK